MILHSISSFPRWDLCLSCTEEISSIDYPSCFSSFSPGPWRFLQTFVSDLTLLSLKNTNGNMLAVFCVFRFITGLCGSAFMSVAGGSVGDLHSDATVGT
jgi:hypothetical protein